MFSEPSRAETFNLRESIIPKVADTPMKSDIKPPPPPPQSKGPPPPPPPPQPVKVAEVAPPKASGNTEFNSKGLIGQDAINAELRYRASAEGKAAMARKKAEKEAKKAEKEANKEGKSMLDSFGMSFPSPFTPAKTTPSKSTALIVRPEPQSTFDFIAGGGTPKRTPKKSEYETQQEIKTAKLKELIHKKTLTTKDKFQLNDLKEELAGVSNPNKEIASNIIKNAAKTKLAMNGLAVEKNIDASIRKAEQFEKAPIIAGVIKRKLTKQYQDAKKELDVKNTGEPLVVRPNTKDLILKKNRERGIKSAATKASKQVSQVSKEQEKIINFAAFMVNENKKKPFVGLKQTEI